MIPGLPQAEWLLWAEMLCVPESWTVNCKIGFLLCLWDSSKWKARVGKEAHTAHQTLYIRVAATLQTKAFPACLKNLLNGPCIIYRVEKYGVRYLGTPLGMQKCRCWRGQHMAWLGNDVTSTSGRFLILGHFSCYKVCQNLNFPWCDWAAFSKYHTAHAPIIDTCLYPGISIELNQSMSQLKRATSDFLPCPVSK